MPHNTQGLKPGEYTRIQDKLIVYNEILSGMRVAAYWSSQMSFLHPGTVTGPDPDPDYVVIQLDDGDSRDIHHNMVRLLPPDYPIVGEADILLSISP